MNEYEIITKKERDIDERYTVHGDAPILLELIAGLAVHPNSATLTFEASRPGYAAALRHTSQGWWPHVAGAAHTPGTLWELLRDAKTLAVEIEDKRHFTYVKEHVLPQLPDGMLLVDGRLDYSDELVRIPPVEMKSNGTAIIRWRPDGLPKEAGGITIPQRRHIDDLFSRLQSSPHLAYFEHAYVVRMREVIQ